MGADLGVAGIGETALQRDVLRVAKVVKAGELFKLRSDPAAFGVAAKTQTRLVSVAIQTPVANFRVVFVL